MGKLKIIIIVCGIIVVSTIGTIAIISNNKNSKTNNINSKTQNQILNTTPSKALTNESITKSEVENKTSVTSIASSNNSESSSAQSKVSNNQVTTATTTPNVTSTLNNKTNNNITPNNSNTSGQILYNNNLSSNYSLNTIVVNNSTGKNILSNDLAEFIRNWILKNQYKNPVIPTDMGTQWSGPWLNQISNTTLMQAFIDANGVGSLSKNITVNEFVKTAVKLDKMTINNIPFTLPEAKKLITTMLQKNGYATPDEITKIIYVAGTPGVYKVYTKESRNNVFEVVAANTGSAQA